MMFDMRQAGVGKTLAEVYQSIFGPSKSAKAFRTIARAYTKDQPFDTNLLPLATQVVYDMAGSQELKALISSIDSNGLISWKNVRNPLVFIQDNADSLNDLKRRMEVELNTSTRLSKDTNSFLEEWVNTNNRMLPTPFKWTVHELKAFRPEKTQIYFRGVRFKDVGEMVHFHKTYGNTGKPFPFMSDRYTSWTKQMGVAERFGRHRAESNYNSAMFGWLSMAKSGKDYSGYGGYVIGARITPESCLVDFNHPLLPKPNSRHGNEGEIITLPNVELVCKVYALFGDLEREVEDFLKKSKTPLDKDFFQYQYTFRVVSIDGDEQSGKIDFLLNSNSDPNIFKYGKNPKMVSNNHNSPTNLLKLFSRNMYDARWVDDYTISYQRMTV